MKGANRLRFWKNYSSMNGKEEEEIARRGDERDE